MDSPAGYGIVSRMLHWLMAACFAWHFAGALLYVTVPEAGVTKFVGSTHFTMGFTLLVLVLLRGAWGLLNIRRRPPHPGRLGRLATMGHLGSVDIQDSCCRSAVIQLRLWGAAAGWIRIGLGCAMRSGRRSRRCYLAKPQTAA